MKRKTLEAFNHYYEAVTKKGFTEYNERETFDALCEAMRAEVTLKEKQNEKTRQFIAKKRLVNKNYARTKKGGI